MQNDKNKEILFVLDHQPLAKFYELKKLTVQNMEIKWTLFKSYSAKFSITALNQKEKKRSVLVKILAEIYFDTVYMTMYIVTKHGSSTKQIKLKENSECAGPIS